MPIGMVHGIFTHHYFYQGTVVICSERASVTNRREKAVVINTRVVSKQPFDYFKTTLGFPHDCLQPFVICGRRYGIHLQH